MSIYVHYSIVPLYAIQYYIILYYIILYYIILYYIILYYIKVSVSCSLFNISKFLTYLQIILASQILVSMGEVVMQNLTTLMVLFANVHLPSLEKTVKVNVT